MSSKASSRIPTFRSSSGTTKVPKPSNGSTTTSPSSKQTPTVSDVGKRVRVAEKEGTLRFVGNVHFSEGIWCGVELGGSHGKNDGAVNGVRYFACARNCGLMAPLCKVSLQQHDSYPTSELLIEDASSGPYSMLFIHQQEQDDLNEKNKTYEENGGGEVHKTEERRLSYTVETSAFSGGSTTGNNAQEKRRVFEASEPHKSCESLVNEVEVKRRRTSSKRNNNGEAAAGISIEKPTSLPQLRSFEFNQPNKSTPVRSEFDTESLLRKLQFSSNNTLVDDDGSKRDSLELEESLGILTPEQMVDGMSFMSIINSRTPSSECIGPLPNEVIVITKSDLPSPDEKAELLQPSSPNVEQPSTTDFSLGIIDEQLLSNLTLKTDTTMNMELPLDTVGRSKDYTLTRLEQTPSPEDLPLDPTPIVESDPKTEPSKSKTSSSFITSITSITSLDTGYQGDGEMSRPASRGADNSPLTRRPLPRPQTRRPDPMTDSDFYTESDADNHEENPLRGDRRAQVIDGTLYGVDPQAAADIYVNNRENMDSSGIFTDFESNSPHPNITSDVSPSDTSTKTISGNSQNIPEVPEPNNNIENNNNNNNNNNKHSTGNVQKDNPKKRNAPSPVVSSPSSVRSPRHASKNEENASKKFKMPKREVTSKVKAMLETQVVEKKPVKKPVGKWDAVMNKISKGEAPKPNLKDVKSKVFNNLGAPKGQETRKSAPRQIQKATNIKARRARARTGTAKSNVGSSVHSSLSDLSGVSIPPKSSAGTAKKRDVVQVTQVLTAAKLSPRPAAQQQTNTTSTTTTNTTNDAKKTANTTLQPDIINNKIKRGPFTPKEKKQIPVVKDCGRATVKGGRTSPVVRPPVLTRAPVKPVPRVAEALAVLVQHLVFNVEAYQVPTLKREVQKFRQEAEQIRLSCQHLEEALAEERRKHCSALEEERRKCADEISVLIERHQHQLAELKNQRLELEERFVHENDASKALMFKQNEDQLMTFKVEYEKLQKTHEETLEILREENEAIREQIDEKNAQIEEAKHESLKLKQDYEAKEMKLKEQLQLVNKENYIMKQELGKLEDKVKQKVQTVFDENSKFKEENDRIYSYGGNNKELGLQEVQSLRVVLELKQNEVAELRRALAEATQRNDFLSGAEEKAATLNARCEDLQLQLQRKCEYEQTLIAENKKLQESFKEEINQKKRLCQYNEELRWKLTQNKEVVTKVLEQAEESALLSRSAMLSASFNERHHSTTNKLNLERTLSFRESSKTPVEIRSNRKTKGEFKEDDESPPSSPKVKGVVEKSDWVSYVLDLDESPEIMAQRIVRRSFRNSTPPKTTPTKSPSNKRARCMKGNPLSLSASASAILPSSRVEYNRSRSVSNGRNGDCDLEEDWHSSPIKNKHFDDESSESSMKLEDTLDLDEDHDVDLKLPALPSEMGRKHAAQALPSPKHLAGEAMISESNSEDESTSSSSVQL